MIISKNALHTRVLVPIVVSQTKVYIHTCSEDTSVPRTNPWSLLVTLRNCRQWCIKGAPLNSLTSLPTKGISTALMDSFSVHGIIWGYHVSQHIWTPVVGEKATTARSIRSTTYGQTRVLIMGHFLINIINWVSQIALRCNHLLRDA